MLAFLSLIITLLCFVQHGVSLSHTKAHHRRRGLTNAQRFARGLPPAPPKRLFGSRIESARRSSVSTTPGQTVTGTIQLTAGSTTYYLGPDGLVTTSSGFAQPFQYVDPASSSTLVVLEAMNSLDEPLGVYLAFGSAETSSLSSDNDNYVSLVGATTLTSGGSAPAAITLDGGGSTFGETTVFMIDPTTGYITTTWVNAGPVTATEITLATDGTELYMGSGTGYMTSFSFTPVVGFTFNQM